MSRGGWRHGKAVVDGVIRYLSASQIVAASHADGGCLAKWHWEKVSGKKSPSSKAAQLGTDEHAKIEEHLTTGRTNFDSIIIPGRHYIPEPGEGLLIEHDISDGMLTVPRPDFLSDEVGRTLPHGREYDPCYDPRKDILVVGFIDVLNGRGQYIDERGDLQTEPTTIEVLDWKFTGAPQYAETSQSIPTAIPMLAYGEWAARRFPAADHLRLSHCYFGTKKRTAFKITARRSRYDIAAGWRAVTPIVHRMFDAAREPDSNRVPYNAAACSKYGGCPHRAAGYCDGGNKNALESFFGPLPALPPLTQENTMGLLKLGLDGTPAPATPPAPAVDPRVAQAVATIKAAKMGHPGWSGEAAKAWAAASGHTLEGDGLAGSGQWGHLMFREVEQIIVVADEISKIKAQAEAPQYQDDELTTVTTAVAPAPDLPPPAGLPAVLPPDAPLSDPALAAAPLPGHEPAPPPPPVDVNAETQAAIPPAPPAPVPPAPPASSPVVDSSELKMSKKVRDYVGQLETYIANAPASPTPPPPGDAGGVRIFVDALPPGGEFRDLNAYVDAVVAEVCRQGKVPDPRVADGDNPLAFGRWKVALEQVAANNPPEPGTYMLRCSGDDIVAAVAKGLRPYVVATGIR